MKKLSVLPFLFIFTLSVTFSSVSAEKTNNHDSTGKEQIFDHYLLSEFNNEISKAVEDFYQEESIMIQFDWWDKKYDVVEIDQSEKGHELDYKYNGKKQQFNFVIEFTVLPYTDKLLGTDTITFGVQQDENLENQAKLLNYEHRKPTKN
ncbi:hypothetical protein ACFSTA_19180 [Ornithinibacillus salinisoli]|uniref:DUF3888 domain-containing protein n=1 Tax=Ornithinibacillus salinisoli TaxID=1848459 RepID=A0ABW4W811_9BACI